MKDVLEQIRGGIFGVAVGDALGVPVEFKSRTFLKTQPVHDFLGYMCWNQPPGTWSDDTSLTLCLLDSLSRGYDLEHIGKNFTKWYRDGFWGAHHEVFDIGGSTRYSLDRVLRGESARFSGNMFEKDNGNGSLMRTLPLAFFFSNTISQEKRYGVIKEVSSITHAHFRSVFSCFIYIEYALLLLEKKDKFEAYESLKEPILKFAIQHDFNPKEISLFSRILEKKVHQEKEDAINSSGYVLDSLEASFWCLLTSDSYEESVLKAVNLGGDTDTTAAITGGLAGLYYGYENIPETWKLQLARYEDIEALIKRFNDSLIKTM